MTITLKNIIPFVYEQMKPGIKDIYLEHEAYEVLKRKIRNFEDLNGFDSTLNGRKIHKI